MTLSSLLGPSSGFGLGFVAGHWIGHGPLSFLLCSFCLFADSNYHWLLPHKLPAQLLWPNVMLLIFDVFHFHLATCPPAGLLVDHCVLAPSIHLNA